MPHKGQQWAQILRELTRNIRLFLPNIWMIRTLSNWPKLSCKIMEETLHQPPLETLANLGKHREIEQHDFGSFCSTAMGSTFIAPPRTC